MGGDGEFFSVGECDGQKTIDGEQVPLVLTPAGERGGEALAAALRARREWVEAKVVASSAVLLRGFGVRDAAEFDAVVGALGWPDIRYVGPAPRTHVHGRVWTANEGPLDEFIYYHHEMVLIKEFPGKVILFCEVAPPEGGETPFVPSFRVTERVMAEFPEMVEELDEKGLRYTFTALSKNDTKSMRGRGWEDAFATTDKAEAEKRVRIRKRAMWYDARFDAVVGALGWPDIRYVGPAPRTHVHGRVWTANEGPLDEFIYYHHEMVLIKEFPGKVILFCEVAPPEGGETPFVPSFRVTERVMAEFPEMVEELDEKGLRYTFTALSKNDTKSMRGRGWEDAFATTDKAEAEKRVRIRKRAMWYDARGSGAGDGGGVAGGRRGEDDPGAEEVDASLPGAAGAARCGEIIEEESIQFRWEVGDVLILDNLATLHGRRPSLPPRRSCKVGLSQRD
uniref:TauD/TfdA-like domain-containing protein n=1 Tax=Oryza barthii TaxID=65489 RepID=A0A0D3GZS0_9ORYZ